MHQEKGALLYAPLHSSLGAWAGSGGVVTRLDMPVGSGGRTKINLRHIACGGISAVYLTPESATNATCLHHSLNPTGGRMA